MSDLYNTDIAWAQAEQSMDELGADSTELRIHGLDYVIVEREEA